MSYRHIERLRRAAEHAEAVQVIANKWLERKRIRHDLDSETRERVVRVFLPSAPDELGARVSECLHNARSALDNLAFALGIAYSKAAFTSQRQEQSEFPIFSTRAPRNDELERKIGCVDPRARRIIEDLQPYRSADNEWLSVAHEASRIDKHRFGLEAGLVRSETSVNPPQFYDRSRIDHLTLYGRVIGTPDSYTELCRYRGWHEIAGHRYMTVPLLIEIEAVFLDEPIRGRSITGTLKEVVENVESEVFKRLTPFL